MLKRILQKIILEQKGQMLPIVLILMLLSGLLIVPTLKYASTSLKAKQVTEKKTLELYAADASVEEALSYLSQFVWPTKPPWPHEEIGPWEWEWDPHEKEGYWHRRHHDINGKTVFPVTVMLVESEGSQYYKITSKATSTDDAGGSNTTITSYVEFTDFSCLWEDYLAISKDGIVDDKTNEHDEEIIGPYPTVSWPTADYLKGHYRGQVTAAPSPYNYLNVVGVDDTIPVAGLYSDNVDGFLIEGIDGGDNKLTLNGTVYIEGDLLNLGFESGNFFTLDLNGQTIFVEGVIRTGNKQSFAVNGTGCIIALGEIEFRPGIEFNPDEFVFIMSVTDKVTIWPNPDFNGAIVGADTVELRSGDGDYYHNLPPDLDLNFPQNTDAPITILSWQIS